VSVVAAGVRDHRRAGADLRNDCVEQVELLAVGDGGAFAGGAADDDAVRAVLDQVPRHPPCRLVVDGTVAGEGGHHRGQQLSENGAIHRDDSTLQSSKVLRSWPEQLNRSSSPIPNLPPTVWTRCWRSRAVAWR